MKRILIFFFLVIFVGCHTLNYKFEEQISDNEKTIIIDSLSLPVDTTNDYTINGMFSEKNNSYKINISFSATNLTYLIELKSSTSSEVLLQAKIENSEPTINKINGLNYPKSIKIINALKYALDFNNTFQNVYLTKNDSTIITDNKSNYYKCENNKISKKENNNLACRYVYGDSGILERILFTNSLDKAYLIIKKMTKGTINE